MTHDVAAMQPTSADLPEPIDITPQGQERLQRQLTTMRDHQRPDLLKQLQRAVLFADPLNRDALANVARHDLRQLDRQIADLEILLERAQVLKPADDATMVQPGSRVVVRYEDGTEETLTIVGPLEIDLERGHISTESAVGKALVGKAPNDKVTVDADGQLLTLQVEKIDTTSDTVSK